METIYRLYYDELIYFGNKMVRDRQVVEDIVVDAFLKLHGTNYSDIRSRRTLYVIVRNKCLNYLRSIKQRAAVIVSFFDEEYIDREMVEAGVLKGLFNALNELSPPEYKSIIEMYYFEEMTCVAIGRELNKPSDTIRSLKRHAIEKLIKTIKI